MVKKSETNRSRPPFGLSSGLANLKVTVFVGIRAQQKKKTRRTLIDAAFSQLCANRSFSNLSLRKWPGEAGIAPTSFYRHFRDMEELGLTLVDEGGLTLRQLMRQARQRIAGGGSVISTSVQTFMEFVENNPNIFRLLLRERSGTSAAFRQAVARGSSTSSPSSPTIWRRRLRLPREEAYIQAEAMDHHRLQRRCRCPRHDPEECKALSERTISQLRMIAMGAEVQNRKRRESLS